jgi:hypothetical protein
MLICYSYKRYFVSLFFFPFLGTDKLLLVRFNISSLNVPIKHYSLFTTNLNFIEMLLILDDISSWHYIWEISRTLFVLKLLLLISTIHLVHFLNYNSCPNDNNLKIEEYNYVELSSKFCEICTLIYTVTLYRNRILPVCYTIENLCSYMYIFRKSFHGRIGLLLLKAALIYHDVIKPTM